MDNQLVDDPRVSRNHASYALADLAFDLTHRELWKWAAISQTVLSGDVISLAGVALIFDRITHPPGSEGYRPPAKCRF
jgi:hypothetical protein